MKSNKRKIRESSSRRLIKIHITMLIIETLLLISSIFFFTAGMAARNNKREIEADFVEAKSNDNDKEKKSIISQLFSDEDESEPDWKLLLVNSKNKVPDNYQVELTELHNGVKVDSRIMTDLQTMFNDMRNDGLSPIVIEGFRSKEDQEKIMQSRIQQYEGQGNDHEAAVELAKKEVAEPGYSEHQLGLAIDINAVHEENEQTPQGAVSPDQQIFEWLNKNAYKYGFILRYPSDKVDITGIVNEPWHYRYVGTKAAKEIYESGLTLEEYLEK